MCSGSLMDHTGNPIQGTHYCILHSHRYSCNTVSKLSGKSDQSGIPLEMLYSLDT
jgi:hypothetical protein